MKLGILKCIRNLVKNIKKSKMKHLIANQNGLKLGQKRILKDGHLKKVIDLASTGKNHGTKK
jgi:hypothetical protein